MTSDRRQSFRAPCDLEVIWRRRQERHALQAADLSPHGMLLLTELEVHIRFVMDLQVSLPAGSIDVFGVVRYVGPTKFGRGVGVSLLALSDTERQSWKTFYKAALSASRETVRLQTGRG